MMKYNLRKLGDKKCEGNKNMVRKNYEYMTKLELEYIETKIKNIDLCKLTSTNHAKNKKLITMLEIKSILKFNQYDIIDFNYLTDTKEERVLIRSKKHYLVEDEKGNINKCYCKIVLSLRDNKIVTIWANKIEDEEYKQKNLKTKYNNNFNIINKTIKMN